METIVPIIVQLIAGAVGGNGVAKIASNLNAGTTINSIAGAIGGVLGTWIAGQIPGLSGFVGNMAMATDTATATAGGLDIGALVGQGVTGLVGGGILTAIAAFAKSKMGAAS